MEQSHIYWYRIWRSRAFNSMAHTRTALRLFFTLHASLSAFRESGLRPAAARPRPTATIPRTPGVVFSPFDRSRN